MAKGLEGKTYEEPLRSPGLLSLQKSRLRGALVAVYTFVTGGSGVGGADLLFVVSSERTREMEWSCCARESSGWPLGKGSSLSGLLVPESDCPGKWEVEQLRLQAWIQLLPRACSDGSRQAEMLGLFGAVSRHGPADCDRERLDPIQRQPGPRGIRN